MTEMRTTVTAPPHWGAEDTSDGRRVLRIPGGDWGAPDMALVLYPLIALPDPASAVIAPFIGRDLPPGGQVKIVTNQRGRTTLGAPMVLVEAQVVDAAGRVVEERLAALYEFLEYGGSAMARSDNPERLAALRPALLEVLASGRADFGGQIAALEQLFVGFPEDVSWGS
jgi:hypothetical protein